METSNTTHYIQHALSTGENYPFDDEVLPNPTVSTTTNAQGVVEETSVTALAMALLTFQVQGKSHIIKMESTD